MELTSRELATLIVFAALIVVGVLRSRDRSELRAAAVDAPKAVLAWKVSSVILGYLAYVLAIIAAARWFGLWSGELLKDTAIVVLFVGLPIVVSAREFRDGRGVVSSVVRRVLGVSAVVIFYVNLVHLPLGVEVILVAVVLLLALTVVVLQHQSGGDTVLKVCSFLLGTIGIGLVIYVTIRVVIEFDSFDWGGQLRLFALSVWLPLALIPFVYLLAIFMSVEGALVRLRFNNSRVPPPLRVRIALLLGLRGSLLYATAFTGHWLTRMAGERTFRSARRIMRDYRSAVRANGRRERTRRRSLAANAGNNGLDDSGLWRDRREFHETKEGLEQMFFTQMGRYRHGGERYWTEPAVVFPIRGFGGLPDDHGMQFCVQDDGQSWMGWRRTVSGFYLGVGGTSDVDAHWRYASTEPPVTYPGHGATGWTMLTLDDEGYLKGAPEWDADDAPIRRS